MWLSDPSNFTTAQSYLDLDHPAVISNSFWLHSIEDGLLLEHGTGTSTRSLVEELALKLRMCGPDVTVLIRPLIVSGVRGPSRKILICLQSLTLAARSIVCYVVILSGSAQPCSRAGAAASPSLTSVSLS